MKISRFLSAFLAICLIALLPKSGLAADVSATWLNGVGNWSDATQWNTNPNYPNNGIGITYDAIVNNGGVALDQDITIQRFFLNGGTLTGSFDLNLNEGLSWTGGTISLSPGSAINLAAASTSNISASSSLLGTINNAGIVNQSAVFVGDVTNNLAGATWNMQVNEFRGTFNNSGTFVVTGDFGIQQPFNNSGTVMLSGDPASVFTMRGSGGTASGTFNVGIMALSEIDYTLTTGATINATAVTLNDDSTLHIAGNSTINSNINLGLFGALDIQSGATLTLNGIVNQLSVVGSAIYLSGGTIASTQPLAIQGALRGSGNINANVSNNGVINPGGSRTFPLPFIDAPGVIAINGNLTLLTDSNIVMEIGGPAQGTQYDYITVSGIVALNGMLVLEMINGFEMQLDGNQTFILLSFNGVLGAFTNIANGARLVTSDGSASFQVNYGLGSSFGADNLVLSDPRIVPEPISSLLLILGAGLIGFVGFRRR